MSKKEKQLAMQLSNFQLKFENGKNDKIYNLVYFACFNLSVDFDTLHQ